MKAKYQDENGQTHEVHGKDLFSQCIQHEIDHLNGVLFIDHLSPLKRRMVLKRYQKTKKGS